MRQVPFYLLIGSGRVASHFQHYLSLLHLPFGTWSRKWPIENLHNQLKKYSHILLLISDQAIQEFIDTHLKNANAILVHFSGSIVSKEAYGAHPLTSFTNNLYELERYQSIPFVLDHDAPEFERLLPGLTNQHVRIPISLKAKYHALCVLSGNFSCMLWQKLFTSFEREFNFSPKIAFPYLLQQTQNLILDSQNALTGPLVRNDSITIAKNLQALKNDSFLDIYKSFVKCYQQLTEDNLL